MQFPENPSIGHQETNPNTGAVYQFDGTMWINVPPDCSGGGAGVTDEERDALIADQNRQDLALRAETSERMERDMVERSERTSGDKALQDQIDGLEPYDDSALADGLATEIKAREEGDAALQEAIEALEPYDDSALVSDQQRQDKALADYQIVVSEQQAAQDGAIEDISQHLLTLQQEIEHLGEFRDSGIWENVPFEGQMLRVDGFMLQSNSYTQNADVLMLSHVDSNGTDHALETTAQVGDVLLINDLDDEDNAQYTIISVDHSPRDDASRSRGHVATFGLARLSGIGTPHGRAVIKLMKLADSDVTLDQLNELFAAKDHQHSEYIAKEADNSTYKDWLLLADGSKKNPSYYAGASHTHGWTDITGKPATYEPAPHTHDYAGKDHAHGWADITGKPSTFPPSSHSHSNYASSSHTHSGYASSSHTHSGYASSSHTHSGYAGMNTGTNSSPAPSRGNFYLNTSQKVLYIGI